MGPRASMTRRAPRTPLADLRQRPAADRGRGPGRTVRRVPVVVYARRLRALRAGAHVQRGAPAQRGMLIRDILDKMRHDGCGGWQGRRSF